MNCETNYLLIETTRLGFPYQPTCIAFDHIQNLVAIGNTEGVIRILGKPGVDVFLRHKIFNSVVDLLFMINTGNLLSITKDGILYKWNLKMCKPEIENELILSKDKITSMFIPSAGQWIYVGTDKGNVYFVDMNVFTVSANTIMWNKLMGVFQKNHPGSILYLEENPLQMNQLLIGLSGGTVVLWDLPKQAAINHYSATEVCNFSWNPDGKYFLCCHNNDSLTIWNAKKAETADRTITPKFTKAKKNKDEKQLMFSFINKLLWKKNDEGELAIICGKLLDGKRPYSVVLTDNFKQYRSFEFKSPIIDVFVFTTDEDQKCMNAMFVLCEEEFAVIDIATDDAKLFLNPFAMSIHESAVNCYQYFSDCSSQLLVIFQMIGNQIKPLINIKEFSDQEWPISGGQETVNACGYVQLFITGHEDNSVKFWNASEDTLSLLYTLNIKLENNLDLSDLESIIGIQKMSFCIESSILVVQINNNQVLILKCRNQEKNINMKKVIIICDDDSIGDETIKNEEECNWLIGFQPIVLYEFINKKEQPVKILQFDLCSRLKLLAVSYANCVILLNYNNATCLSKYDGKFLQSHYNKWLEDVKNKESGNSSDEEKNSSLKDLMTSKLSENISAISILDTHAGEESLPCIGIGTVSGIFFCFPIITNLPKVAPLVVQPGSLEISSIQIINKDGSPTNVKSIEDIMKTGHYVIVTGKYFVEVISLGSYSTKFKTIINDKLTIINTSITDVNNKWCLISCLQNGQIYVHSLPNLDLLYVSSLKIKLYDKIFPYLITSKHGQIIQFASPSELQKLVFAKDQIILAWGVYYQLYVRNENGINSVGRLFFERKQPDPPKIGILDSIFNSSTNFDRKQLFGETIKPITTDSKRMPSNSAISNTSMPSTSIMSQKSSISSLNSNDSAIGKAKMAAIERGERLGKTEDSTSQLRSNAEKYADNMKELRKKAESKKWFPFL